MDTEEVEYKYECVMIYTRGAYIYLFGVLRRFQHCTGHITTGSWEGRGNQYIQFVRVLYCKLLTNGKQLPAFPLEAVPGTEPRPRKWEASRGAYSKELENISRKPFWTLSRKHSQNADLN